MGARWFGKFSERALIPVVRVVLVALILVSVRLQIWFLSVAETDSTSYSHRGIFVPLLLAVILLAVLCATFGGRRKSTRSEEILARIRRLQGRNEAHGITFVASFAALPFFIGLFIWSLYV